MFKFCNGIGTYRQKLCHVTNSHEDLRAERVSIVFKCLFELGINGYELN
jgi:hypothetical protein